MAKLNTLIPDDLNKQVRDKVARVYGVRRGAMKDAVIEALRDWIKKDN
jgi:tryptophan synthase beta subunit